MLQVHADNRAGPLRGERIGGHDVPCPRGLSFLARLEHGQQRGGQLDAPDGPAQRDQSGQVHVMAAGVHCPGLAGPGRGRLLGDRQGVELRPDRDAGAGGRADAHEPAGSGDRGRVRDPERGRDGGCRPDLCPGELGMGVQLVPELDRVRQLTGQRAAQGRPQARALGHRQARASRGRLAVGRRLVPALAVGRRRAGAAHAWSRR
jgi:hypothetical protein